MYGNVSEDWNNDILSPKNLKPDAMLVVSILIGFNEIDLARDEM